MLNKIAVPEKLLGERGEVGCHHNEALISCNAVCLLPGLLVSVSDNTIGTAYHRFVSKTGDEHNCCDVASFSLSYVL